jgi:hypothetical protein
MSIKGLYPTTKPSLLMDFCNTEVLDPRITSVRASVGTYYDANGVLQTAPSGVARFQFDPVTGVSQGLLRENQATNLVLRSEEFDNAYWLKSIATITSNTVIAPDGTLTGDKLVETISSGIHAVYKSLTLTATSYTASYYMKSAERTWGFVQLSTTALGAYFDLQNGVVGTVDAGFTASIQGVGNGWYRCSVTTTATAASWTSASFPAQGNGLKSYTGDGVSGIYIWGAQLEANSYPTSYIKTVASQVTRAADTITLTNTDVYNTAEFTAVSSPFGVSGVSANTVTLNGDVPIERLYVYPRNISQDQINSVVGNDGWWSWRIVGATFALPLFAKDGTVIVDWGDGTVETLTTAVHTFTNASPHTVRFRLASGTYFRPRIASNATYKNMVRAVGSAPSNMIVDCFNGFYSCTNLKSFDATLVGKTDFTTAWFQCSSLTSFPVIDTSSGTNFGDTWNGCTSLTSFPLLDMSLATNLNECWDTCTSLTSFPAIDFPVCTNFTEAWSGCSSLTSFPLIDTSAGTNFINTWFNCSSLTSFPLINTSSGTNFTNAWRNCYALTSFPLININNGTNFTFCWEDCNTLTDFPAGMFDSWTGVPVPSCFVETWGACGALTTTSVENILVSIDTSGVSAPATNTEITIDYNVSTGALTTPTTDAITSLKGKSWTIKINGVLQ